MRWLKVVDLKPLIKNGDVIEYRDAGFSIFKKKRWACCVRADGAEVCDLVRVSSPDAKKTSSRNKVPFDKLLDGKVGRIVEPETEPKKKGIFSKISNFIKSCVERLKLFFNTVERGFTWKPDDKPKFAKRLRDAGVGFGIFVLEVAISIIVTLSVVAFALVFFWWLSTGCLLMISEGREKKIRPRLVIGHKNKPRLVRSNFWRSESLQLRARWSTMSVFGRFFAKKKKKESLDAKAAIQRLLELEDQLAKKQDYLEVKIEQEKQEAKRHGTKNKRDGLRALRRMKGYQAELARNDGTLNTLQNQRNTLENASMNTQVLHIMSNASKAMKQAHNNLDVEDVYNLMDDINEQTEMAKEVAEAISKPFGFQAVDDEELLAELENLEIETMDNELLKMPKGMEPIPSVDAQSNTQKKKTTEEELAELRVFAE
ncbi:hypothetical protein M3Y96_00368100 [Aphelenchoides besseyi]|nr:hypothetical protein M3Y96_00368100 [Aphelenchoides besseyi]